MRECPTCLRCFGDELSHCPVEGQATINSLPGEPTLDGRYLLERRLGQGGMGVVYKAHHVFLKSPHAIKVIMPDLVGNDPSVATRFRQEAMAAAAIRHPNIISVTDYGFIGGEIPFLVMEFVEGDSLQDVLSDEGKFSPEKALDYIRAIASGVGAAHQHGIVHRDLKPLNIMIQRNRTLRDGLKVLDFGLAKIKSGELLGSFVGAKTTGIIGSPYYMAPEQWSDEEPDKRCDIYSLGIILHQMLTGDVPFKGSSVPSVMKKHHLTPPPRLASVPEGISEALERVVHHALEKDPEARTATAEDLVAELEQAVLGVGVAAGKTTARGRTRAKPKTASSRSKDSVGTRVKVEEKKAQRGEPRITAEQKKAERDEEAVARETADQEEARRTSQGDEPRLQDETVVGLEPKEVSAEVKERANSDGAGGGAARKAEEAGALIVVEPAGRRAKGEGSQDRKKQVSRKKEESSDEELGSEEQESWRRAAQDARRRAEERALLEAVDQGGDALLTARAGSLAPQAAVPAPSRGRVPLRIQIPFATLVRKPLVLGGVGVLIITVMSIFFLARTQPASDDTQKSSSDSNKVVNRRDMALIEGGTFTMGSDVGTEQKPAHTVAVVSFYMDKTEVTNLEYSSFIKETGHPAPANDDAAGDTKGYWTAWNGTDPPPGREKFPVCNVTTKDAEDFVNWLSKRDGVEYRLPSEEEWEYAARNGSSSTLFPWGNSWVDGRANINGTSSPRDVGSFPEGATQSGLLDMVGNVWEWTASKGSYYSQDQERAEDQLANRSVNIFRGGSFAEKVGKTFLNATDRTWNNKNKQYKHPAIGFRLLRDAR